MSRMSSTTPAAVSAAHALLRLESLTALGPAFGEDRRRALADVAAAVFVLGPGSASRAIALADEMAAFVRRATLAADRARGLA